MMNLRISEVQIIPIKPVDGLVAFASIVFDDCLFLSSIGIHTRPEGGYRLSYPTRKTAKAEFKMFHPINKEVAHQIDLAVIGKYEELVAEKVTK